MKHDWEYKKLGELVSSINGLWTGKKEPFITIPVISLKNFTKDCKLKKEDYSIIDVEVRQFESRKLQYGDIIIEKSGGSDTQPVGRPILFDIKEGDYSFSNFTNTLRVNDANKELLNSLFLHNVLLAYYRQGKTFSLQSKTTGIHNLDLKGYLNFSIPVPPLPTQQSIVSELDSLSKIIADCKETLKDYDALEQSIFYDMFGDPVKNEKGWEVKKLGEVCKVISGFAFPSNDFSEHNEIKAVKITNVGVNEFVFDNMSLPSSYLTKSDYILYEKDIVIALTRSVISTGFKRAYVPFEYDKSLLNQRVAALKITNLELRTFVYNYLGSDFVKNYVMEKATALMQPNLSIGDLKNMPIFYPANQLLQQFASKIEAIEKMKSETKKALQETETLFQARMDYWFN